MNADIEALARVLAEIVARELREQQETAKDVPAPVPEYAETGYIHPRYVPAAPESPPPPPAKPGKEVRVEIGGLDALKGSKEFEDAIVEQIRKAVDEREVVLRREDRVSQIRAWILEAGDLPKPGFGDRVELAMLLQFNSVDDFKAASRGTPVSLGWIWDRKDNTE